MLILAEDLACLLGGSFRIKCKQATAVRERQLKRSHFWEGGFSHGGRIALLAVQGSAGRWRIYTKRGPEINSGPLDDVVRSELGDSACVIHAATVVVNSAEAAGSGHVQWRVLIGDILDADIEI